MCMVLRQPCDPNHSYAYSHWTSKSQLRHINDHGKQCFLLAYRRQIHTSASYETTSFGGKTSVWYGAWGTVKGATLGFGILWRLEGCRKKKEEEWSLDSES